MAADGNELDDTCRPTKKSVSDITTWHRTGQKTSQTSQVARACTQQRHLEGAPGGAAATSMTISLPWDAATPGPLHPHAHAWSLALAPGASHCCSSALPRSMQHTPLQGLGLHSASTCLASFNTPGRMCGHKAHTPQPRACPLLTHLGACEGLPKPSCLRVCARSLRLRLRQPGHSVPQPPLQLLQPRRQALRAAACKHSTRALTFGQGLQGSPTNKLRPTLWTLLCAQQHCAAPLAVQEGSAYGRA